MLETYLTIACVLTLYVLIDSWDEFKEDCLKPKGYLGVLLFVIVLGMLWPLTIAYSVYCNFKEDSDDR